MPSTQEYARMAAEPTSPTTPQALEAQAPAIPAVQVATPALTAVDDATALKAQVESLLKWKASAEVDLQKGREKAREAAEKAAREEAAALEAKKAAGELGPVLKAKEEELARVLAERDRFKPLADRYEMSAQKKREAIEAARERLPAHVIKLIDVALKVDVDEAADFLAAYDASAVPTTPAAKQAAPLAPSPGAAPSSPPVPKSLADLTPAQIKTLPAAELQKLLGRNQSADTRGSVFSRFWPS